MFGPVFAQEPRARSVHDEWIVRVAPSPHQRRVGVLFPAGKQDARRERIDVPRARVWRLVLEVLAPVVEHVGQRATGLPGRGDDLLMEAIRKHRATATTSESSTSAELTVDVLRRGNLEALPAWLGDLRSGTFEICFCDRECTVVPCVRPSQPTCADVLRLHTGDGQLRGTAPGLGSGDRPTSVSERRCEER